MTPEEWETYSKSDAVEPFIAGTDFPRMAWDSPDRLLCEGYNLNGGPNVRIWLDWRQLIGRQYDNGEIEWKAQWPTRDLYPSKRAYREETDLLFATLMRDRYMYGLSFTTWRITA